MFPLDEFYEYVLLVEESQAERLADKAHHYKVDIGGVTNTLMTNSTLFNNMIERVAATAASFHGYVDFLRKCFFPFNVIDAKTVMQLGSEVPHVVDMSQDQPVFKAALVIVDVSHRLQAVFSPTRTILLQSGNGGVDFVGYDVTNDESPGLFAELAQPHRLTTLIASSLGPPTVFEQDIYCVGLPGTRLGGGIRILGKAMLEDDEIVNIDELSLIPTCKADWP